MSLLSNVMKDLDLNDNQKILVALGLFLCIMISKLLNRGKGKGKKGVKQSVKRGSKMTSGKAGDIGGRGGSQKKKVP